MARFRDTVSSMVPWIKRSGVSRLLVTYGLGQPKATPRNYTALSKEGYQMNAIVFRCVNLIAGSASTVPLRLKMKDTDEVIDSHPILDLLARPNVKDRNWANLVMQAVAFRLLSGNTYFEGTESKIRSKSPPLEIFTHRPDRMKVVPGPHGLPEKFVYAIGSNKREWAVNPVDGSGPILHIKRFNPLDDWYGMSPIEAAAMGIDAHNDANRWNTSQLQNSGKPSMALVYTPREGLAALTREQYDRTKKWIKEEFEGPDNAGKPMVIGGNFDFKTLSLTPQEMEWLKGKQDAAREISLAFDVPEQLVGIEGSQKFDNFEHAILALWDYAVCPNLNAVVGELGDWLLPQYDGTEGMVLEANYDDVPALGPRRREIAASLKDKAHLTINEKREAEGKEPYPGGDVILIPATSVPLTASGQPASTEDDPNDQTRAVRLAYGD